MPLPPSLSPKGYSPAPVAADPFTRGQSRRLPRVAGDGFDEPLSGRGGRDHLRTLDTGFGPSPSHRRGCLSPRTGAGGLEGGDDGFVGAGGYGGARGGTSPRMGPAAGLYGAGRGARVPRMSRGDDGFVDPGGYGGGGRGRMV